MVVYFSASDLHFSENHCCNLYIKKYYKMHIEDKAVSVSSPPPPYKIYDAEINLCICSSRNQCIQNVREGKTSDSFSVTL